MKFDRIRRERVQPFNKEIEMEIRMINTLTLNSETPPISFRESNGSIDETIEKLIAISGTIQRPALVRSMILAALKAGNEDKQGVDLKIMNTTLKEMRYTAKVFSAYPGARKVTVFGSARTAPHSPVYEIAKRFGKILAESDYMVITGGGAGIMQAVNEGAGSEHSFGVNIRLPWEDEPNDVVRGDPKSINYKYFFNRKLAFLKEAYAIAVFPGGFGTHDEAMEALTLLQTGKLNPLPMLFIDAPGGDYWKRWKSFVCEVLLAEGYFSETDLAFFRIVDSAEEAIRHIDQFYHNYHSLRYVQKRLVMRLKRELPAKEVDRLKDEFADILIPSGSIVPSKALAEESNETEILDLPRLIIDFDLKSFSRLRMLIDAINL